MKKENLNKAIRKSLLMLIILTGVLLLGNRSEVKAVTIEWGTCSSTSYCGASGSSLWYLSGTDSLGYRICSGASYSCSVIDGSCYCTGNACIAYYSNISDCLSGSNPKSPNCCVGCSCSWTTGACGGGSCDDDERLQTYSCSSSSCPGSGNTQCAYSSTCCTGCDCSVSCGDSLPLSSCSGPGCSSGTRSCTKVNSCGNACGGTNSITCYACTAPAAPATPTSVSLRVNTTDYNLSTNSASPTMIDYRNGGTIKIFSNSTTDYYKYDVYNAYTGGTSLLDYAGTTQIQPASGSLAYSTIGRFEARHYNFKCPDNSRNYSGTKIGYYCLETYPPSVSATNSSAQWFNTQRTANISSAQVNGCSALSHTRYKWGSNFTNSSCDSSSGGTETSNGATLNAPSGGTTLYLCARNTANIVSTWSGTYRWENTPPTVSATNSSSNWFDEQRTATVSANDTGGSGLAQVRYNWGSNAMNPTCDSGGTVTSNGATLNAPSGGTTLYLCARDNAGNTATWSGTYNWCTPTVPQDPTDIFIKYQGGSYTEIIFPLSSNLSSPTRLPVLHDDQTGTLYIPEQTPPACASNYGYTYETSDGGGGDYTSPYYHTYDPQGALRDEGDTGDARGRYYNHSMAGTLMTSNWRQGYYKINNNPVFGCPDIVNDEDDRTSSRDCVSTTHTGIEVNNPLKFEIIGSDLDGVDEIKGAIVWLSRDGTSSQIPKASAISSSYEYSDPNHIAVMVLQRNGSWANSPLLYAPDSANGYNWGNITSSRQITTTAGTMATVNGVNVTVNGENVNFNIEIIFNEVTLGQIVYPEGNYNISGLVFDEHMLLAGGTVVDQFYMSTDCRAGGWNIDLRNPTFETGSPSLAEETGYARDATLLWNFDGTGSYATDAVINGYSNSPMEEINLKNPPGYEDKKITPTPPPPPENIGKLNDTNAWAIPNPSESVIYDSYAVIGIGSNEEGEIIFYVTGFDQACNYISKSTTINFNPWMPSKGGLMYSGGNVGANSNGKYYSAYDTFIDSVLRKVTADELDIGTEVVTSRSGTINYFVQEKFRLSAVRASGIYNSNNEMSSWYEYLSDRLDEQMVALGQSNFKSFEFPDDGEISENRISNYCSASEEEYCYMNVQGNLDVVPSFIKQIPGERRLELICDKKTLIMASGNIHIEPDIINGGETNINGCIFVAGGSITIGAGDWVTQNVTELEETKYDYLDAYLVADDMIDIQFVEFEELGGAGGAIYTRDGLEIYGGLVAFGRDIPQGISAVQVNRKLGVWSAYIPPAVITWDPRYAKLAELFFGSTAGMYKREVGFKPY